MTPSLLFGLQLLGDLAGILALAYGAAALVAVLLGPRRLPDTTSPQPAITILKPLCGAEPLLYDNLRSFCTQDYPYFQIVFGANEADDPALAIARRLQREFPALDIAIVSNSPVIGSNRKIDNLAHMLPAARHDHLVMADSDIRVTPDYLGRVAAPLTDPAVGIVTCLYRGRPLPGFRSRLAALFIDDWFAPSVLLAHHCGGSDFGFGATIGMRRHTLAAIGGFAAVANHLADDYRLGALTRAQGLRTVLSDYVVETMVNEPDMGGLIAHEQRWMQAIRMVRPASYLSLIFTFSPIMALLGAILATGQLLAMALLGATLIVRVALHAVQARATGRSIWANLWLLPLRDLLTVYVWCRGLWGHKIVWRGRQYAVVKDGSLRQSHDRTFI